MSRARHQNPVNDGGRSAGGAQRVAQRVIFLNRFFYPDHSPTSELLSELAFALAERDLAVNVITSRLNYDNPAAALPPRERIDDVEVWRVWTSKRGRQQLVGRALDYLTFYLAAGWRLWRLAGAGDIVVAKTDPPLLSIVVAPIAWLRRARLVNWLQDIFPEVAEALNIGGRVGRVGFRVLRPLRNWSLRMAAANVVVGTGMAARLEAQGVDSANITTIQNWADGTLIAPVPAADNPLRKEWVPHSRFVVGYAGNLGRAHDVDTIVEAMTLLQQSINAAAARDASPDIMFVFVGGGAQRARLEREVLKRRLANIRMRPYQPRERVAETLGLADLHLVSLRPSLEGLIVPSKFYGIAAAGRPMLFLGAADGEIGRLVEATRCGFSVAPGDGRGLMLRIQQLADDPELCASMGARARAAFEQHWDKGHAMAKWAKVLEAVGPDVGDAARTIEAGSGKANTDQAESA
jgi:colanic acid biosynthesis glycosyl transferase WcaI